MTETDAYDGNLAFGDVIRGREQELSVKSRNSFKKIL